MSAEAAGGARQLLLMRHAKSDWDAGARSDLERPLNARGRKAAARMGRWLRDEGLAPDRVLCSPATRTRQTLEIVRDALVLPDEAVSYESRIYEASPGEILALVGSQAAEVGRLLVVGHNPAMEMLAAGLPANPPREPLGHPLFPTAALACFETEAPWAELGPGGARLLRLVRPKELGES